MTARSSYGATAKVLHWLIVALLLAQYMIGWLMPDIPRGMDPGPPMLAHISFGMVVFVLIVLRFAWRLTHPVAPDGSLPRWQRLSSEIVHRALYALVFLTALSGWNFVAFRAWSVRLFAVLPLPLFSIPGKEWFARGHWHQVFEWTLLAVIGVHVAAALVHVFFYRDGVMRRMLRA
ncbi:MAG: cytochrome b [Xanthobacteraceae bacterium]